MHHLLLIRSNGKAIKLWTTTSRNKNEVQRIDDQIARTIWNRVQPQRFHVNGRSKVKRIMDWKPIGKPAFELK